MWREGGYEQPSAHAPVAPDQGNNAGLGHEKLCLCLEKAVFN